MSRITVRQRQALEYISKFLDAFGRSPSASELASGLGLAHHTSGNQLVRSLHRKGLIGIRKLNAGGVEVSVTADGLQVLRDGSPDRPYHALRPAESLSELIECMQPGDFIMPISSNAMSDLDIRVGDLVVVRPGVPIHSGEICVVSVDDHNSTLRRVLFTEENMRLVPANQAFAEEIIVDRNVKIHGAVIARLRVRSLHAHVDE